MGEKTRAALKEYGAVYLHAVGGAAQFYARCLPKVHAVYLLEEIGIPEAMWVFEARNFPAIVTMDSHGSSLHAEVAATTGTELAKIGAK
jgi:fumarate hydratase class I